ncbi:hypothetical protein ACEPPN_015063 [Leptodophora sp. 'Broadleaf-Isolate-01']
MSSPTSSPSATPSRPLPSRLQAQCVTELSKITNQLLDKDTVIRFRCLAYHRFGRSPVQRRCEESCETQARPEVFERAKRILQRNSPVTYVDYVGVIIRILFCKTHSEAQAFKKYRDLLEHRWKGEGAPEELILLEAIRQAYQLPATESTQAHIIKDSTLSLHGNSSNPQLESRITNSGEQPEVEISLAPTCIQRGEDVPQGQNQPLGLIGTSMDQRKYLVPNPPSQRNRSRSNPPHQRNENNLAQGSNVCTKTNTTEEGIQTRTCSTPSGIPPKASFEFSFPAHNIQLQLRPVGDEMARLHSAPPAPYTSSHEPDILLPANPAPSEEVSNSAPETVSGNPQPNNSTPAAFKWNEFLPDYWDRHDFSSSFFPFGGRIGRFRPTAMAKSSKDDTFLEQLSKSAADTAPTLFETTIQHKIPAPTPNNRSDNNPDSYMPAVVDTWIRDTIKKPVTKEGFVYILKAPEYFEEKYPGEQPRVKIGISVDVKTRIAQLKKDCGISVLERVDDRESIPHHLYYKVEELVHGELANFRRVLKCENCKTAHREWFAVSEEVALQTVQRWRRFILREPYDENGLLTDQWSQMLRHSNLKWPGREEEYDDHEKRNDRWNRWLDEGIRSTRLLK